MKIDPYVVADWTLKNAELLPNLASVLKILSTKSEKAQQFDQMKFFDLSASAITTLIAAAGLNPSHTSVERGGAYKHNVERRAWRHIHVVGGPPVHLGASGDEGHWIWDGSLSMDGIPVISVPKGWPHHTPAAAPHYDVSTGADLSDPSYAPPTKLKKGDHSVIAVYRALWFVRKCDPTSPQFDPTASLAPRQRLINICGVFGQGDPPRPCVNPDCYVKQAQSTARQELAAVRAKLPAYATDAEVQRLMASASRLCRAQKHHVDFNSRSGRYGRCNECRRENNAKQAAKDRVDSEVQASIDETLDQKDYAENGYTEEQLAEGRRKYAEHVAQQALANAAQKYAVDPIGSPVSPVDSADPFAAFMSIPLPTPDPH